MEKERDNDLNLADLDTKEVHELFKEFMKEEFDEVKQMKGLDLGDLNSSEVHEVLEEFKQEQKEEEKRRTR